MYNCLYALQQFVGDYVRAAMTCIKFYTINVATFRELAARVEHLTKVRKHLRQALEQKQCVEVDAGNVTQLDETLSLQKLVIEVFICFHVL